MPIKFEVISALGGALGLLLLVIMFFWTRFRGRGTTSSKPSGPATSRFICARCARQFPHSKRTLNAWDKGSRRFFCALCHAAWAEESPAPAEQQDSKR